MIANQSAQITEAPRQAPRATAGEVAIGLRGLSKMYFAGRCMLGHALHEHGLALLVYIALSIALSWPTLPNFTTAITGAWHEDPFHNLWILWHTQQVVLGQESPFYTTLLYYPHGISLLIHGLGPITGLFALPFWGLGAEAAHNATLLISLCLTGYFMYLLARSLGLGRGVALFASTMLLSSPMCLAGLFGHITKVFLGALPLMLLTIQHALNPERNGWWVLATAGALLVILLHNGYQFVFATLAIGFFLLTPWITKEYPNRQVLLKRSALIVASTLVLVGPLLIAIVGASSDPTLLIDRSGQSSIYQADLLRFVSPSYFSRFFSPISDHLFPSELNGPEVAVSLSLLGICLCLLVLRRGTTRARTWSLFTLPYVRFALGPRLKVFGTTYPIDLPYGLLADLPGLSFMRVPGRFMMMGFVGFGITASFGLAWLTRRWPRQRNMIVLAAIGIVLIESWPMLFPQQKLPAIPHFYQEIANDNEQYGIFDLPVNPTPGTDSYVTKSAMYQIYQMTHHKGIAGGYISRSYKEHPLFAQLMADRFQLYQDNLLLNGRRAGYDIAQAELARYGYRYVVWHKAEDEASQAGDMAAAEFIDAVFGKQAPLIDDDLIRVYQVGQPAITTTITFGENWRYPEPGWRWVRSPATLSITSPREQRALLQITPDQIYDPATANGLGTAGVLIVQVGDADSTSVEIITGRVTTVPLALRAGRQTITLSLQAGNFQPRQYGSDESATLSFAIRSINLQTQGGTALPADIHVDYAEPEQAKQPIDAIYGSGWYDVEPTLGARWASTPATLFIYSPAQQHARIRLTPALLYAPESANGLGDQGLLQIAINETPSQRLPIRVEQPLTFQCDLRPGWNSVLFALKAGGFRPADIQPGSTDHRRLSFALSKLEIVVHN